MIKPARGSYNVKKARGKVSEQLGGNEKYHFFYPPVKGLVTSDVWASDNEQSMIFCENFLPTTNGIIPRGGSKKRVSVPSEVKYLFAYQKFGQERYFIATDTSVYNFTDATLDNTALSSADFTSQTSSNYSHLETQTDGGSFVILVNGADNLRLYNGTAWQAVTGLSTPIAITGIATTLLSHVWNYNNRVFFIENNSFNAWYLPTNSIGGMATRLPLTGIFSRGGQLLCGMTLSSDSGSGYSDRCVFITTSGEFAVYSGDPSNSTWKLEGIYRIARPLGKNAYFKVFGDVIIMTKQGLLSLKNAMLDYDKLQSNSISRAIRTDLLSDISRLSSSDKFLLISNNTSGYAYLCPPDFIGHIFVVNLETMAWSRISGWQVKAIQSMNDKLFFGGSNGWVYLANSGGNDDGKSYECKLCYNFTSMQSRGYKIASRLKQTWKHSKPFLTKPSVASDYSYGFGSSPDSVVEAIDASSDWDLATWDISPWGTDTYSYKIYESWQGVSSHGEVFAPQIQITSNQPYRLDCELIGLELCYIEGRVIA